MPGTIINFPERDADGNLVYLREVSLGVTEEGDPIYGELILDYLGQPLLAYENARRPRFILQGKSLWVIRRPFCSSCTRKAWKATGVHRIS